MYYHEVGLCDLLLKLEHREERMGGEIFTLKISVPNLDDYWLRKLRSYAIYLGEEAIKSLSRISNGHKRTQNTAPQKCAFGKYLFSCGHW